MPNARNFPKDIDEKTPTNKHKDDIFEAIRNILPVNGITANINLSSNELNECKDIITTFRKDIEKKIKLYIEKEVTKVLSR